MNYRYGLNLTFGSQNSRIWRLTLLCAVGYCICHIWDVDVYPWTSNLGDILLLIAATVLVKQFKDDLVLVGEFADFLHQSNAAFNRLETDPHVHDKTRHSHGHSHGHHRKRHHSDANDEGHKGSIEMLEHPVHDGEHHVMIRDVENVADAHASANAVETTQVVTTPSEVVKL